jgi:tRNA-dihydrouridine synthase B
MIFLAPLQGYTDFIFRNVYSRHYKGIDIAISPFISMSPGKAGILRVAKDVLPTNNFTMAIIPQLMGNNAEQFISMAQILGEWGYEQLNWNLGCPVPHSTRKKRGCGLMPYPELVREILERVIPRISQRLSVKTRLGLNNMDEIYKLIPVLNDFSLENIIIHPRIGIQMYDGEIHHEVLKSCLPLFKHEIIYNGDIKTADDFLAIKKEYPSVQKWMIGRGIFYNPLLPSLIKGNQWPDAEKNNEAFLNFLLDLYNEMKINKNEEQVVYKVKDLWKLFSKRYADSEKVFDQISHASSTDEIIRLTRKIVAEEKIIESYK